MNWRERGEGAVGKVRGQPEAERKEVSPGAGQSDTEHLASYPWKQTGNSITREQEGALHQEEAEKRKALDPRTDRENLRVSSDKKELLHGCLRSQKPPCSSSAPRRRPMWHEVALTTPPPRSPAPACTFQCLSVTALLKTAHLTVWP